MKVYHPPLSVVLLEVSDGFLLTGINSSYLPYFINYLMTLPLYNFDSIAELFWLQVASIS